MGGSDLRTGANLMSRLTPGTVIDGRLRVVRRLDGGKPSDVYEVEALRPMHYARTGARLAFKVFKPWVLQEEHQADRIRQELEVSQAINSPRVVKTYEIVDAEVIGLTMKLVDGTSLEKWMQNHKDLDSEAVVSIAYQLAQGIAKLHEQGVAHRDIKPANIMVSSKGIVLLDLGVVRPQVDPGITSKFTFLGNIRYAAPEYLFGESYDHRVDIFSFGLILHELALGEGIPGSTRPWSRQVQHKEHATYHATDSWGCSLLLHRHGFRFGRFMDWLLPQVLQIDPRERIAIADVLAMFRNRIWDHKWPKFLHRYSHKGDLGRIVDRKTSRGLYSTAIDAELQQKRKLVNRSKCGSKIGAMIAEATHIGGGWPPKDIFLRHIVSPDADEWGDDRDTVTKYLHRQGLLEETMHRKGYPMYNLTEVGWRLALDGYCDSALRSAHPRKWWEHAAEQDPESL